MNRSTKGSCEGKVPFFTRGEARDAIKKMSRAGRQIKTIYSCDNMIFDQAHYHISSMTRTSFKNIFKKK